MRAALLLQVALAAFGQTAPVPKLDEPGLYATFDTTFGIIRARLFEKETLNTVRNFVGLVQGTRPWNDPVSRKVVAKPLYRNLLFHRVIPYFMVQTGDPTGIGNHDCGFVIPDEIVPELKFDVPGRLAMANIGRPNTGACQIFITEVADTKMNGKYTIFGQVVEGMDVVKKLARVIVGENDKPKFPVKLKNVTLKRVFAEQP